MTEPEITADNCILTLLQNQRAGECLIELSEGLRALTKAVRANGKKGSMTLTISIEPINRAGGSAVGVTDVVAVKAPQMEREIGVFFANEDGSLTRNDPRQRELPLRAVDGAQQPETQATAAVS